MRLRVRYSLVSAVLLLAVCAQAFQTMPVTATTSSVVSGAPTNWKLVWRDEFDGANGSPVDSVKWNHDTGGAWGNGAELQYYTNRVTNSTIENGSLQITALRENYLGNQYTSARIQTQSKFSLAYGRFEARIKIPKGKGIWPAFWLIGDNIDTMGWPACGEIDIMEHINSDAPIVSTIHMPTTSGNDTSIGSDFVLPGGIDYSADFHLFAAEWESNVVRFYVDNMLFQTVTRADLLPNQRWVFDHPYFVVLNVAVGGAWPGYPDSTTIFPATMQVDYVRVYERSMNTIYIPLARVN